MWKRATNVNIARKTFGFRKTFNLISPRWVRNKQLSQLKMEGQYPNDVIVEPRREELLIGEARQLNKSCAMIEKWLIAGRAFARDSMEGVLRSIAERVHRRIYASKISIAMNGPSINSFGCF